jgi:hypothetical protein
MAVRASRAAYLQWIGLSNPVPPPLDLLETDVWSAGHHVLSRLHPLGTLSAHCLVFIPFPHVPTICSVEADLAAMK